jgi:oxygen-independent coproporphyrinogen-3 oxidase
VEEARRAVEMARSAGFDNINLDLIFGIPSQTMETWQKSLSLAQSTGVEHLSLYNLTIEEGTPLFEQVHKGEVQPIDPDMAADMYEYAIESLAENGFLHYEISNWAARRNGSWQMCRHNLQYWRNLPYLGFGVGAHGFFENQRLENTSSIMDYLARLRGEDYVFPRSPANIQARVIDAREQMNDTMMLGLRLLIEGVDPQTFQARFGVAVEDHFSEELKELTSLGLVEKQKPYRLTRRGMMVGNQVFMRFVGE